MKFSHLHLGVLSLTALAFSSGCGRSPSSQSDDPSAPVNAPVRVASPASSDRQVPCVNPISFVAAAGETVLPNAQTAFGNSAMRYVLGKVRLFQSAEIQRAHKKYQVALQSNPTGIQNSSLSLQSTNDSSASLLCLSIDGSNTELAALRIEASARLPSAFSGGYTEYPRQHGWLVRNTVLSSSGIGLRLEDRHAIADIDRDGATGNASSAQRLIVRLASGEIELRVHMTGTSADGTPFVIDVAGTYTAIETNVSREPIAPAPVIQTRTQPLNECGSETRDQSVSYAYSLFPTSDSDVTAESRARCSTGRHEFTSFEEFCSTLVNDVQNSGCIPLSRAACAASMHCPGAQDLLRRLTDELVVGAH